MAIQPIDLQTLFTQLDKVAKSQSVQREGAAMHEAIQGAQLQRRTEEQIKAVNEAQNTGEDGAEKVKDRGPQAQDGGKGKKQEGEKNQQEEAKAPFIHDPSLGRNIDISL
jgi:DNA-binding protein H-NS